MEEERRELNMRMMEDIAEIKTDIKYIREMTSGFRKEIDSHVEENKVTVATVNKHSVLIGLIYTIFVLAAFSLVAQNVLAKTGFQVGIK